MTVMPAPVRSAVNSSSSSSAVALASRDAVTGIVAAMPEELAPLRARVTGARRIDGGGSGPELVRGRLAGASVVLAVTGDGDRNARAGIASLLSSVSLDRLVAVGVAGALSPDLGAGDLVVSERVVSADGTRHFQADPRLCEGAARDARVRRGVVVTAGRIVDTVADKRSLLAAVRPGALAAVVDLESAAYAEAAAQAAIPWIVLRAVSDTAAEALPALLNRCRDDGGAVRRGKVAFELLGDPSALPVLLSLRRRVRGCAEELGRAVERFVLEASGVEAKNSVALGAQGGI